MTSLLMDLFLGVPFYALCAVGVAMIRSFRRAASPRLRRFRFALVALFIITFLVGAPAFGNLLLWRIEHAYEPAVVRESDRHPDNLVIVLTGGWFRRENGHTDVKISEDGWERLDAGVKLWKQIGGTLLITGAPAPDGSGHSAAAEMARVA